MAPTDLGMEMRVRTRRWSGRDAALVRAGLLLVVLAAGVGQVLNAAHVDMNLYFPPLFAHFGPHVGPGTIPVLLLGAVGAMWANGVARRWRFRWLLWAGLGTSYAWTALLALVDGWQAGWAGRLTTADEYLHDLPRIGSVGEFLRDFSRRIVDFQPGAWTTHVSSHPPLATLVFWALDRVGLSGGGWAGTLVILVGASAPVAVALTLRALGAPLAARRALPFLVFLPGAVWVGVSADGLFAGAAAWSAALLSFGLSGRSRIRPLVALAGGLLFGAVLYLSYGLALFGIILLAVAALAVRRCRRWPWPALIAALVGVGAVVVTFQQAGFSWLEGLAQLHIRYYQGVAARRPYAYFVWANLAVLVLSAGPLTVAALGRIGPVVSGVRSWGGAVSTWATTSAERLVPAVLGAATLLAVLAADITGLSKAETERIWLPFAFWLAATTSLLPRSTRRWGLPLQIAIAVVINHLTRGNW